VFGLSFVRTMWVASLVTRLTGLCLAYAAFSFAAEKVRQPLLIMTQKQSLLDDIIAALEAWVETTVGKNALQHDSKSTGSQKGNNSSSRTSLAHEIGWEVVEVDPADLCQRCMDGQSTIVELQRVAQSMGIPYPGEPFEPCELCRDRALSLRKLERRFSSLTEANRQSL